MSARVPPAGAAAAAVGESSAPWLHAQSNSSSHQLSASDHLPLPLPYNVFREESGRLTDGRHFKRFWLRGSGGKERLVVSCGRHLSCLHNSFCRGTAWAWHAWAQPGRQSSPSALSMPHAACCATLPGGRRPLLPCHLTAPPHCPTPLPPHCPTGQRRGQHPQGPAVQVPRRGKNWGSPWGLVLNMSRPAWGWEWAVWPGAGSGLCGWSGCNLAAAPSLRLSLLPLQQGVGGLAFENAHISIGCCPLQEDMGGFTFENSREVMCWVNFVLQRPATGEPVTCTMVPALHACCACWAACRRWCAQHANCA